MTTAKSPAFFSYARENSAVALRLAADLKRAGANVWLDQLDLRPGRQWDREVEQALSACREMIVILSPAAIDSNNVMDEIAYALEERKTVIPLLVQDCRIPLRLRRVQYVDFRLDYEDGVRSLLNTLAAESQIQAATDATAVGGPARTLASLSREIPRIAIPPPAPERTEPAEENRIESEKAERNRIERQQADAAGKAEQDRIKREQAEAARKAEQERIEREQAEAAGKAEQDRIEHEQAEAARKAEQNRIEREKAEAARKAEQDRIKREQAEAARKPKATTEAAQEQRAELQQRPECRTEAQVQQSKGYERRSSRIRKSAILWIVILMIAVSGGLAEIASAVLRERRDAELWYWVCGAGAGIVVALSVALWILFTANVRQHLPTWFGTSWLIGWTIAAPTAPGMAAGIPGGSLIAIVAFIASRKRRRDSGAKS
jgi:hypothetical protein